MTTSQPEQHNNFGSSKAKVNAVSSSWDYLVAIQPMADSECSGNLFENNFFFFAISFHSHLRFSRFIHGHLSVVRLWHHQLVSVVLMLWSSTSIMSHMAFMEWFSLLAQKALMLCSSLKGWKV